ncbi:MAG: hypothetical protein ACRC6V_02265 [Bacteroidales bacterium]
MEMVLCGDVEGSVMVNMASISEVEEMESCVRLHMTSGNSYVVTGDTFAAALQAIEGIQYMKITEAPVEGEEEEVTEVEGEVIPAE